jgi:hypothetical protein
VFVIARSTTLAETVVAAFTELLPGVGSVVVLVTAAVFMIVVPAGVAMLTTSTIVKDAEAPEVSVAIVQTTFPVPPTVGVVHGNAGPEP